MAVFSNLTGKDTCNSDTVVTFSSISRLFEITNNINHLGTDSVLNSQYEGRSVLALNPSSPSLLPGIMTVSY